ncbi:MAG: bifunctional ornithine acetyltransferase/N-acetylglutamate synthase, partial [Desulfobacula sp.]|nr:bifunctional ornithine acetyltransferase/N-acetylglutamate synthase [Desulfobacula sp.]
SAANEKSFNRITIDGDTSTNDMLLALANGASGVEVNDAESKRVFQNTLDKICFELARMIVKDGEGATKLVQIIVKGAQTKQDAFKASETIAHSNLVKTAIYGEDPNWGRITAAAGRSGAHVVPEKIDLFFDDQPLVLKGNWLGAKAEKHTAQIMKKKEIIITLDLNLGEETDSFLFCDFSIDYVKINAEYRS